MVNSNVTGMNAGIAAKSFRKMIYNQYHLIEFVRPSAVKVQ